MSDYLIDDEHIFNEPYFDLTDFNIGDKVETLIGHKWNDYMRGDLGVVSEVNTVTGMITVEFDLVTHDIHFSDLIRA